MLLTSYILKGILAIVQCFVIGIFMKAVDLRQSKPLIPDQPVRTHLIVSSHLACCLSRGAEKPLFHTYDSTLQLII
jgi:hypothetical protein